MEAIEEEMEVETEIISIRIEIIRNVKKIMKILRTPEMGMGIPETDMDIVIVMK